MSAPHHRRSRRRGLGLSRFQTVLLAILIVLMFYTGWKLLFREPEQKQEHGFVLVWPVAGESRWDTARRLRVREENLKPAGRNALVAFRR